MPTGPCFPPRLTSHFSLTSLPQYVPVPPGLSRPPDRPQSFSPPPWSTHRHPCPCQLLLAILGLSWASPPPGSQLAPLQAELGVSSWLPQYLVPMSLESNCLLTSCPRVQGSKLRVSRSYGVATSYLQDTTGAAYGRLLPLSAQAPPCSLACYILLCVYPQVPSP